MKISEMMNRRRFIAGSVGSLAAAAIAHSVVRYWTRPAWAAPQKKVLFWFHPNGKEENTWWPSGGGTNFSLNSGMQALEPHKQQLAILKGIDYPSGVTSHESGADRAMLLNGSNTSFDVALANQIGAGAPRPYLATGAFSTFQASNVKISKENGTDVLHDDQPIRLYERIFGAGSSGGAAGGGNSMVTAMRDKRVMDLALGDLNRLRQKLGQVEKDKLDNHIASLERVQTQVEKILNPEPAQQPGDPAAGDRCGAPTLSSDQNDFARGDNYPFGYFNAARMVDITKLQLELTVLALECGITPVAMFSLFSHTTDFNYAPVGAPGTHHGTSHSGGELYARMKQWDMEMLAYTLELLANSPDTEGGSLLDNTLVYSYSEISVGMRHNGRDVPIILAGAGVGQGQGRYLDYGSGNQHVKALVSVAQWAGWNTNTYEGADASGPLPDLI